MKNAVSIFFNLEKAYDTTWKCEIMKDFFWTSGDVYPFLFKNGLAEKKFQVSIEISLLLL